MVISPNHVLIKPDRNFGSIKCGEKELYIDTTNEPGKHTVTSGTVVAICDKLIFDRDVDWSRSCLFDTDIEAKVGDRVIFHPMAFQTASALNKIIDGNYLIRYDDLFMAIRGEELIVLNGGVIAEAIEEEIDFGGLIIPDTIKQKSKQVSVVRYLGTPLRGYYKPFEYGNGPDEENMVQVGDKIVHSKYDAIELQNSLYQIFNKNVTYYRMHYKDIDGVLTDHA